MEILKLDKCKGLDIRIYSDTVYDKNLMRIVAIGIINKNEHGVLENMTIPKSYINAKGAAEKLLTVYGGKCMIKHYENAACTVRISGKKKMREVMEWINSLMLIYTLAN